MSEKLEQFSEIINSADNIAVICAERGSDSVAAGIAMQSYIQDQWGKKPSVIYHGDFADINPMLLDLEDVSAEFEPKILKVMIDYADSGVKSVNYYKRDDSQLVLEIRPVERDFDTNNRIKYELEGIEYDLIIVIGAHTLESIGDIYEKNKEDFMKTTIINVDNSSDNQNYGRINVVDPNADSLSALLFSKFAEWGYVPGAKASKSLLLGLSA